jgi:hypothetical protein
VPEKKGGPRAGEQLERYLSCRRSEHNPPLAAWERDEAFLVVALALWPDDCEGAAIGRESNRQRLRLRYEGFRALARSRELVAALRDAADDALKRWKVE